MKICLMVLVAVVLAGLGMPAPAQQRFDFATAPGRLTKEVVPSHYRLRLDLDPARPTFEGEAVIALTLARPQAALVVHASRLVPLAATLQPESGPALRLKVLPDAKAQTWRLTAVSSRAPLAAGAYTLTLRYRGQVNRSGEGLFRTAEKTDPMLATQLQAVHARTLFPGFDEPAFRAAFEIEVRAPKALQVLSNMPAAEVSDEARDHGRTRIHRFAPTPAMPSYLVAVAVGRFDLLEGQAAGVPLRIATAPGKRELGRFALLATEQSLGYYNGYFGLPYALPKLDQLAVPSGRFGAMEDWGLISYAEPYLLLDPASTSPGAQRRLYDTVAHEIAHQWFGNLVTASSWDEIWLNEAFATWIARKVSTHFNPGWQVPLSVRMELEDVLARDAGSATRAIRSGAVSESQVFDVFDSITYDKGGAVLSMVEAWLGADVFQRGLAAYMADRRYSNATAGDLWHHLSAASGFDVSTVARSWTDQTGHPLVQAESACEAGRTRLVLRQQRYLTQSAKAGTTELGSATVWAIPVRVAHASGVRTLMLDAPERAFDLPGCAAAPPLVNAEGLGFYRVQYTAEAMRSLVRGFGTLPAADQVTLASDALALAMSGRQPLALWFDLLAAMPQAQEPGRSSLLGQAAEALDELSQALAGTPAQEAVARMARAVLGPELQRLGWQPRPGEDDPARLLRSQLVRQLARFDDPAVLQTAGELYDQDRAGQKPLDASVHSAIVYAAGRGADRSRFDRLRAELLASRGGEERQTLAEALAAGRDAARADELMGLSLSGKLPPETAIRLPGLVATNSGFGERAYRYTRQHWRQLAAVAGNNVFGPVPWLLPSAAAGFNQRAQAEQLRADQARLAGPGGALPAGEVADAIERRAALREREASSLPALLAGAAVR